MASLSSQTPMPDGTERNPQCWVGWRSWCARDAWAHAAPLCGRDTGGRVLARSARVLFRPCCVAWAPSSARACDSCDDPPSLPWGSVPHLFTPVPPHLQCRSPNYGPCSYHQFLHLQTAFMVMVSSGLRMVVGGRKPGFHCPPAYRGRASGQWEPAAGRLPSTGAAVMAQVVPEMWTRDLGCPVVHGHQA